MRKDLFGNILKLKRKAYNFSSKDLAKKLNTSLSNLSHIETGRRTITKQMYEDSQKIFDNELPKINFPIKLHKYYNTLGIRIDTEIIDKLKLTNNEKFVMIEQNGKIILERCFDENNNK